MSEGTLTFPGPATAPPPPYRLTARPFMLKIRSVTSNGAGWIWLDARHRYVGTGRQLRRRTVPHVAAVATATALATGRPTTIRPTPHRAAAGAGPVVEQDLVGRGPVRQSRTHPPKSYLSHQFENPLRKQQRSGLTYAIASFATPGTIGKGQPRNCMIYSRGLALRFGSARRTLDLACR